MIRRYAAYAAVAVAVAAFGSILWMKWVGDGFVPEDLGGSLVVVGLVGVGVTVLLRRPENSLGPLFTIAGVVWALTEVATSYAGLGGGAWAAALGSWASDLAWGTTVTFGFLLFPNGRLPSRRWRPVAWTAAAILVLFALYSPFLPGPLSQMPSVENPFGVEALAPVRWVDSWIVGLFLLCVVASFVSVFARYRSAPTVERQQIKWAAYVAALLAADLVLAEVAILLAGTGSLAAAILNQAGGFLLMAFLVSIGVAILRHGLFDIDLIINRTLVYGALTATLVLVYLGSVVLLQYVLRALTGGESQLAIVASTLGIAALFSPLRRRIQTFVDRRFYRRKYDAVWTLSAFAAKLREETDLDALERELVAVVGETVAPEHVSLWLRYSGRGEIS